MSNRPLCERPGCFSRGYHWDSCATDGCPGCQPRLALDGKRLCRRDEESIATDARVAARLRAELAKVLIGSGQPGEKTSGTSDRGMKLNDRAVEARTLIRHRLVSWSLMIAEERGFTLPEDTDEALAEFIATSADWLSAHQCAGEAADELRELVTVAHPIAYPTGTRVFDVAPCPNEGCGGTLKAVLRRTDALLPSSVVCSEDQGHEWPASQWLTLGRYLRAA